jgi:hypothetical protein
VNGGGGQSQMLPLNPVVTSITPAHDSTNVGKTTPIVIRFSQPMETRSVESAFSTSPVTTGAFAWSPARDTMTFTPGGVGYPTQSMVSVRITATARAAASGNSFYSAFESRFKTGPGVEPVAR